MNPHNPASLRQVVVVPTQPSRATLLERALRSIAHQTRQPSRVIVVRDGFGVAPCPPEREASPEPPGTIEELVNRRTPGLAGALNTALDHLARTEHAPEHVLVSFLDDDDWWEPGYLRGVAEECERTSQFLAAAIVRHDPDAPDGAHLPPPPAVDTSAVLTSNPGIQGSNLSVRLDALLMAGGMDEALTSCTDRDLVVRLLDLGARFKPVPRAIAHHDAHHGLARLSNPSLEKHRALVMFFEKHGARMSAAEREQFWEYARARFGCARPSPAASSPELAEGDALASTTAVDERRPAGITLAEVAARTLDAVATEVAPPLRIIAGITVTGVDAREARPLIEALARLNEHPRVDQLEVVLAQNCPESGYDDLAERARALGLRVLCARTSDHECLAPELGLAPADLLVPVQIAAARTLLHRYVHAAASHVPGAIAWILDDDLRLPGDLDALVADVLALRRDSGADVVIGTTSGAPPVPVMATMRTQLVDLAHLLVAARNGAGPEWIRSARQLTARVRARCPDYYYDLSSAGHQHLETPCLPPAKAETHAEVLRELAPALNRIPAGAMVTRPIEPPAGDVLSGVGPRRIRGGNTLVFDLRALELVGNLTPRVHGRFIRRADNLWATHVALRLGMRVVSAPLDLIHDRESERESCPRLQKVLDDILGHAAARATEVCWARRGAAQAPVSDDELRALAQATRAAALERFAELRLAFWRCRGLAITLRRSLLSPDLGDAPGEWLEIASGAEARLAVELLVERLEACFHADRWRELEQRFDAALAGLDTDSYFRALEVELEAPRPGAMTVARAWCERARTGRARAILEELGVQDVVYLGQGREGVVLRLGETVYKVFDAWSHTDRLHGEPRLRSLAAGPRIGELPRIVALRVHPVALVMESEWEPTGQYAGGHGPALASALRALVEAGWVHSNLAPRNMRVGRAGVRLIDLGRSLEPATAQGAMVMARRAHLSWRFGARSDLDLLLARAREDDDFPELVGWRGLHDAIVQSSPKERLDERLREAAHAASPRRVLDFGCGRRRPRGIVGTRADWVGFEPDREARSTWSTGDATFEVWDEPELEARLRSSDRFDVVVCSLVLCTLDDAAADRVLGTTRSLITEDGTLLLAVCDPTSYAVPHTTRHTRDLPAGARYGETFGYQKRVGAAQRTRTEVHRPVSAYRRMFARAGFTIVEQSTVDGVDVDRFEPVSEFLIFRLRPLPRTVRRTALLIKTCALESHTAVHQLRHIAEALGTPRAFDEVVAVVDPHAGPFPRSYGAPNMAELERALEELIRAGWIHRVVWGPRDGEECERIGSRWFGRPATRAHAANGQATLALLSAFDDIDAELALHVDADVMIARRDGTTDWIARTRQIFEEEARAVTLALPVLGDAGPCPRTGNEQGPYRVESQVGWVHLPRLRALLPLPNQLDAGQLRAPWHRALDEVVRAGRAVSLRSGLDGLWYASPDNGRKHEPRDVLALLDRVEANHAPALQAGRPAIHGALRAWMGPKRREELVIVGCGRNVGPGRLRRCFESLATQRYRDWGAVLVDDASDDGSDELLQRYVSSAADRMTLVRRRERAGLLANTHLAVHDLIEDPESVVVLLDLDDALGRTDALEEVLRLHRAGADLTIGSMVRTDKQVRYAVDLSEPRASRGGNVWQHLRTFRKRLFDRLEPRELQHDGKWIDVATDWALMIPMVELAADPRVIRQPNYLHEPRTARTPEVLARRAAVIARISARPRRSRSDCPSLAGLVTLAYHRVLPESATDIVSGIYRRRGMIVSPPTLREQLHSVLRRFQPVTLDDIRRSVSDGAALPEHPVLVTFDDGYRDFVQFALPELVRLGVPAVAFVRPPVADGWPKWAPLDLVYHSFARAGDRDVLIDAKAREALLKLPCAVQDRIALACAASCDRERLEHARRETYLCAVELRELAHHDVELGFHGVDHVRMNLLDQVERERVFDRGRRFLTEQRQVTAAIAYPDGATAPAVERDAAAAGFDLGFAFGAGRSDPTRRLALARFAATNSPTWVDELAERLEAAQ